MKRQWRLPLLILGALLIIYLIAGATGMLTAYKIPTRSNEPNVNPGSRIWVSNLVKPQRLDFICYRMDKSDYWDGGTWMMRLCGLPGDTIQIVNGSLFVNGKDVDASLNLKRDYFLPKDDVKKLGNDYFKNPEDMHEMENDSVYVSLETDVYKHKSLHGTLLIDTATAGIENIYHHPWSRDNFGPIIVPAGKFFVLGDHRHSAADSRYTGFIDKKRYLGTLISIH